MMMVPYEAMFSRQDEHVTLATVARNTYRYAQTTVHARIATFYELGVAYVVDSDTYDHSCEYTDRTSHTKRLHGTTWLAALRPNGIKHLRLASDRIATSPEVLVLCAKIFHGVTCRRPLEEALAARGLDVDVVGIVAAKAVEDALGRPDDTLVRMRSGGRTLDTPFKVQHHGFWSKCSAYRVVDKSVPPEEGKWSDLPDWILEDGEEGVENEDADEDDEDDEADDEADGEDEDEEDDEEEEYNEVDEEDDEDEM